MFYASPWYDFDVGIHVGRYLAGDSGLTFETRRTFDNGFSIGLYKNERLKEDFGEEVLMRALFRDSLNLFTPFNTALATAPLFVP